MHHLFPTPVGMFDLGRKLTDEEMLFVNGQDTKPNEGNSVSSNGFVLRNPAMTSLRGWVEDCVTEYFTATCNPKEDVNLKVTQSWFNYSKQGQHHHKHFHPNSFVSGVFYVTTNFDDRIYFSRNGWQQIKFEAKEWNLYNSDSWWFEAIAGRLVLFPSWVEHNVPTVQGINTRISMSFNTFPVGMVGDDLKMTGLKLEA